MTKKSEARAVVSLIFKPFEVVTLVSKTSAKTEEERKNATDATEIVKLLKETFQDIAELTTQETHDS